MKGAKLILPGIVLIAVVVFQSLLVAISREVTLMVNLQQIDERELSCIHHWWQ